MASRFPLILNDIRFLVNPTQLQIAKGINYGTLPTQSGVRFQVWYNTPEVLTITGASAGNTAYQELLFLRQQFSKSNKVSTLFYKTTIYRGFITALNIDHNTAHLNQFTYSITFQLLFGEVFASEDFSINAKTEGFLASKIGELDRIINAPLNSFQTNVQKLLSKI